MAAFNRAELCSSPHALDWNHHVLLNMIGRETDVLRAAFIAVSVNVALNLILVPRFGMMGAAISSAGS